MGQIAFGFFPTLTVRMLSNNHLGVEFLDPATLGDRSNKVLSYSSHLALSDYPLFNVDISLA